MFLCVGKNRRSLWNVWKWNIPNGLGSLAAVQHCWLQAVSNPWNWTRPQNCAWLLLSALGPWGWHKRSQGSHLGFVCSIKRCPDKCCACSQTHPPFHQWSSFFLLITEYWRFPTLPYLLLDWRIILEGVKMTPLSAVWISLIFWGVVCDGTSWD